MYAESGDALSLAVRMRQVREPVVRSVNLSENDPIVEVKLVILPLKTSAPSSHLHEHEETPDNKAASPVPEAE